MVVNCALDYFFLQVLMLFSRYVCERAQCQLPLVLIQCLRYLQWVRPIPCGIKWRHYHYCLYCQLCTSSSYGLDLFGTDTNNTIYPAEHKSNYVIRIPRHNCKKIHQPHPLASIARKRQNPFNLIAIWRFSMNNSKIFSLAANVFQSLKWTRLTTVCSSFVLLLLRGPLY